MWYLIFKQKMDSHHFKNKRSIHRFYIQFDDETGRTRWKSVSEETKGNRVASLRIGFTFGGRMHMWLLITRTGACTWVGRRWRYAHRRASSATCCTVEREYKRLKAKRKQTGSSSSKPNSGGVKLRGTVSAVADASAETFFPLFPIIFPHYFFKRPVK